MKTENQTLQQLLSERVTAFADGDRPREIIDKAVEAMFVEWCRPGDRAVSEVHRLVFTDEFDEPPFFDPEAALVSARQVAAFAALDAAGPAR